MLLGQQALMQMIQCELEHLIFVSVWIVVDEDIWGHALPMVGIRSRTKPKNAWEAAEHV